LGDLDVPSTSDSPPRCAERGRCLATRRAERLVAARRERLSELLDGWSPEREADLAALLTRLARHIAVDHPDGAPRVEHVAGAA
jgi:hypothetical protein